MMGVTERAPTARAGRPPRGEDKLVALGFRAPPATVAWLRQRAADNGRTVSQEIADVIELGLRRSGAVAGERLELLESLVLELAADVARGQGPVTGRRVWLAVVYPIGNAAIFGGAWDRDRFHWSRAAAEAEAVAMARELALSPIEWSRITEVWAVGRCHKQDRPAELYGVTVRGVRLPKGSAPE